MPKRVKPDPPDQLQLVDPTPRKCHWCGAEYLPLALREEVGACEKHRPATLRQIDTIDTRPLPF